MAVGRLRLQRGAVLSELLRGARRTERGTGAPASLRRARTAAVEGSCAVARRPPSRRGRSRPCRVACPHAVSTVSQPARGFTRSLFSPLECRAFSAYAARSRSRAGKVIRLHFPSCRPGPRITRQVFPSAARRPPPPPEALPERARKAMLNERHRER